MRVWKRAAGVALAAVCGMTLLAGCGSSSSSSSSGTKQDDAAAKSSGYEKTIQIDVYDDQANYQGVQKGWFGKLVKDKFNMELNIIAPNVAGGGNTLYETRSANGNLGDLIITNADSNRLKDMVTAGLVLDISDYMKNEKYLKKYSDAIATTSKLAGQDGTWAVPSEISELSPVEPTEVSEPTNAPSLRWDLYEKVGKPDMKTLDDLIPVLSDMQTQARKDDGADDIYAISLFKDWDGSLMQNAVGLTALYGYKDQNFALEKVDGSEIQSCIDSDSMYVKALKFLYDANQAGIVDPESSTQNFDNVSSKYTNGKVLYSLWPWLGTGYYNTSANTAEGKGFATATIDDMKCLSWGNIPSGKASCTIMVGSKAQDPQRMVDFINWLYSPEGIMASCASNGNYCGPEGLTWENDNGTPKLTDFGVKAFIDSDDSLTVPDDWGTGTWKDGVSALNYKPVGLLDKDDDTGICYNYQTWDDYKEKTATKLSENWSADNGGDETAIQHFEKTGNLMVMAGTDYATPEYSTDINTIKEQCKSTIVEYSWKMVFASSEDEFNSLLDEMQSTAKGLGYDQVYAIDKKNCEDHIAKMKAAAQSVSSGSTSSTETAAAQ